MKRFKQKMLILSIGAAFSLTLAACNTPTSGELNDAFGVLADEGVSGEYKDHKGHKGHRKGKMRGKMMKVFFADLNLSEAQKAAFKQLKEESRAEFKAAHPNMKERKEAFKKAFVSDSFDPVALRGDKELNAKKWADMMASKLTRAWGILDTDQQGKLVSKFENLPEMGAKKWGEGFKEKRLAKMATELSLSAEQMEQLKALPAREGKRADKRQNMQRIVSLLQSGASSAELSAVLEPMVAEGHGMQKMERLKALHAILTPEQRQIFVEKMQHKKRRHHGRHF